MTLPTAPPRRMLVTDLDGTLVGNPAGLARMKRLLQAHRERWLLVYATGRTMTQARRLAQEESLPEPDVWVTEVGAAITYRDGQPDETWRQRMGERWDRDLVERIAMSCPQMTRQPEEAMGPFKLSFRIQPDDARHVLPALDAALHRAEVPALLIYSSQRDLDVVPAAAGKGAAVRHLILRFGLALEAVLTCGDSANDYDMLCLGCPAVAVGNAHPELTDRPLPPTVLRARGTGADGIIEALRHFGWIGAQAPAGKVASP